MKGEDPFGIGRWSYITLRGKGVTAYLATPGTWDNTYHQQQDQVISRMQRQQNIQGPPQPRRQFIFDLQSWLQDIEKEGHQIILAMDANVQADNALVPY
jgi:hypothetical protein